jgi:signal transduction histidine kinase/CheY-like chemotaxis protein
MYYGLLIAIGAFTMLLAPSLRDRSYLWFALHLVFLALFFMEFNLLLLRNVPLLRDVPPGNLCDFLISGCFLSLALFVRSFFFSHRRARLAEGLLLSVAALCAIGMTSAPFVGLVRLSEYTSTVVIFALAVITWVAAISWLRGFAPATIFLLGWAIAGVGLLRVLLMGHSLNYFSEYGHWGLLQLGTSVYAVVLSLALAYRVRILEGQRRKAEAERSALQIQIERSHRLESLGIMAGGVAHDFNNLLATLFANTDLAMKKLPGDSPLLGELHGIKHAGKRMAELAERMLDYTGREPAELRPVSLSDLVRDTLPVIEAAMAGKPRPVLELSPNLPAVKADATQLRQVLMNLLTNAAEAVDEDGAIRVRTGEGFCGAAELAAADLGRGLPEGRYVYLEVQDTGVGMDDATRARIFEPFYTTKFTGRGLGLAPALSIVKTHRAFLRITSAPGRGTTLRISLPAADVPVASLESATAAKASYQASGTVLLVDDEEDLLFVTALALQGMGFHVLTASEGKAAIDLFRREADRITVVILDQTMPGMNGKRVVRELRGIRREVPIILYSGYSEEQVLGSGDGEEPDFFLKKPFDEESLTQALRAVLGN